ncbi:MAG: Ig-like domain-containing protein, partial [Planctomycetota bacterium]|nr:Ig-like domain-containing protein [Planctomycetota bacterium]
FDLDGGAVNCVIEYCYSYDNQGPGFLVAEFVGAAPLRDNAIRYNVSFNDGRANGMGGIHFWNGKSDASLCENIDFYGNLIVAGPNTTGPVVDYQSGGMRNIRFFNNIFVSQRGLDLVKSSNTSAFTFQGNAWHAIDGNHDYVWGGTTYDSLAAWRTAAGTPETRSGAALGIQADPGMVDLASMPKPTSVAQLDALTAFRLADASPCIDAGQDLSTLAISDDGGQDFFGASLPLGAALDIGPHERAPAVVVVDPPSVSISAPSGGSSHEAGAGVGLAATASSAGSTVSSVRFTITPSAGGSAVFDRTDTSSAGGWTASWVAGTPGNYRIDATATDADGRSTAASSASITVVDTTAPSVPGQPVASQVGAAGCQLDWAASSDVVGVTAYRILRDGSQIGTSTGTSFTVTGLQLDTSYAFSVRAVDAAGNVSAASSSATVVTVADPPTVSISAPSGGSSHEAGATVSLAATASSAESTVSSVRFTITPSAGGSAVLDQTDTSSAGGWAASWVASTPGNYRIDATATDAGGRSTAASSTSITVVDTTAPSAPGLPVASQVSFSGCQLDWAASSDVVGVTTYRILRDGSQIGTSAGTSFTVTGLQAETSYAFSVRAVDAAGNVSAASSTATVVTLADSAGIDPPTVSISAPSGGSSHEAGATVSLAATVSSAESTVSSVRFTITPSAGGSAVLDYTDTSSAGGWTASWVASTPGNYRIDATATDAGGRSTAASSKTITVVDTTAPSVPGQPVASQVGATGCQLDWAVSSDVVGVTTYRILRDGSQIGTSAGTSFTVIGLQAETSYAFSVRAADAAGNVSAASSAVTVVTLAVPVTRRLTVETVPGYGWLLDGALPSETSASPAVFADQDPSAELTLEAQVLSGN